MSTDKLLAVASLVMAANHGAYPGSEELVAELNKVLGLPLEEELPPLEPRAPDPMGLIEQERARFKERN